LYLSPLQFNRDSSWVSFLLSYPLTRVLSMLPSHNLSCGMFRTPPEACNPAWSDILPFVWVNVDCQHLLYAGILFHRVEEAHSDYTPSTRRRTFLLTDPMQSKDELKAKAESFVGKTLQARLPLQIEGIQADDVFTFKINKVNIAEERQREEKASDPGKGTKGGGRRNRSWYFLPDQGISVDTS